MNKYLVGYIFSIILTLIAFGLVTNHLLSGVALVITLITLATIQLLIQLIFFLHLVQEPNPRWNLALLLSALSIILILVIGSIVIMNNLSYRHSQPSDLDIIQSEGIKK